ncbi:MAG: ubiquinol-cytochrome C chaperone family protein [Proteobacteria bacterium]|nr:ubiquinol-cytochrome C chaperone family protein [Pseudomonadota bacterium]
MAFTLKSLFRKDGNDLAVREVYGAIVEQARKPAFYGVAGVPDTATGRFAMVALHGFLAMDRLGREQRARDFSQGLFDLMFADMDRNLREMGVGDLSVGKKVKGLAKHFFAMAAACREGMKGDDKALNTALRQYVYLDMEPSAGAIDVLTAYMRASVKQLSGQDAAEIVGGKITFAPPPGEE